MPTEAEWEYACRAGSTGTFCFGDDEAELLEYAWFKKNAQSTTYPGGMKKPNAYGIYDMHGNVYEWCQDYYTDYEADPVTDPQGGETGPGRVIRGGGMSNLEDYLRSFERSYVPADTSRHTYGFRVVRVVAP